MQASKIQVRGIYALRLRKPDSKETYLVRYSVSGVVTRRKDRTGSPHDFESHVEGWVNIADVPKGITLESSPRPPDLSNNRIWRIAAPDQVEGPYEEVIELKAKAAAERAALEARHVENKRRTQALRLALYHLAGLIAPEKPYDYRQPIRATDTDVNISHAGVEALYHALVKDDQ